MQQQFSGWQQLQVQPPQCGLSVDVPWPRSSTSGNVAVHSERIFDPSESHCVEQRMRTDDRCSISSSSTCCSDGLDASTASSLSGSSASTQCRPPRCTSTAKFQTSSTSDMPLKSGEACGSSLSSRRKRHCNSSNVEHTGCSSLKLVEPAAHKAKHIPIDSMTTVPEDLFTELLLAGREARRRGQHRRARAHDGGMRLRQEELVDSDRRHARGKAALCR